MLFYLLYSILHFSWLSSLQYLSIKCYIFFHCRCMDTLALSPSVSLLWKVIFMVQVYFSLLLLSLKSYHHYSCEIYCAFTFTIVIFLKLFLSFPLCHVYLNLCRKFSLFLLLSILTGGNNIHIVLISWVCLSSSCANIFSSPLLSFPLHHLYLSLCRKFFLFSVPNGRRDVFDTK